ncbi:MAG TPA: hypothetical protein VGL61_17770 [Kofleriaceae bacterium]|jgi:hypothetical protein
MATLEARVACPFCGGHIHPVAGRCKHCKEDLSATRAGRSPAQTPLPPLVPNGRAPSPTIAATYISPVPVAMPAREGSAPILPPRPTGRSVAVAKPEGSPLRSWPVVVIGLAAVAIIAAVAIMVWPAKPAATMHDRRGAQPPPAPERMDSDPMPQPASKDDPWAAHSQADPPRRRTPDPLPPAPPAPDSDNLQLKDFSGLTLGANTTDMMMVVMTHACARLKTCPHADESLRDLCDSFSQLGTSAKTPDCDAARQCLEQIDKLDCSQAASPATVLGTIPSCLKAETSC